jgi:hypothetical protein
MNQKTSWIYFVIIFLSAIGTMLFHEFGHYIAGVSLGYHMQMNLSTVRVLGEYKSSLQANLVTLGGPLFTLSQIIIVALVLLNRKIFLLYPLLIAGVIFRVLPYLNIFFNYDLIINEDEAKLSAANGLSPIILPFLVLIILIGIVIFVNYRLKISYKKLIITVGAVIISSMILFGLVIPLVE